MEQLQLVILTCPRPTSCDVETKAIDHLALRNLDITIEGGRRVAICGRTGSGKSSTILLLLRLLEPIPSSSGSIQIDGLALHEIDRQSLRQRIIAVPQDAVFLPEGCSFQANLDPFNASSEIEGRSVLETVGLWAFVSDRGGLAASMSSETLSQGQKQLFSLARAILRRRTKARGFAGEEGRGILLLDEVSSSVDQETHRKMQKIIHDEFQGYTIIMVSHRLDVVLDCDMVIVMDSGAIIETGSPQALIEENGSRFGELWRTSTSG